MIADYDIKIDKKLKTKLDLMVKRLQGVDDNLVLIDGDEGTGKSNIAAGICYYVARETGRDFTVDNVFFSAEEPLRFAASEREEQVILLDEAAFDAMASDWQKKSQRFLTKLLMTARKKRHFIVMCIPKFFKLSEYFVVDRSIALIHTYARKGVEKGRFFYYTKKKKENLFYDWKRRKMRNYSKHKALRGTFAIWLPKVIDEAAYNKKKDKAIMGLVEEYDKPKEDKSSIKREIERDFIIKHMDKKTSKEMADALGISERTIYRHKKQIQSVMDTPPENDPDSSAILSNKGLGKIETCQ